MSFVRASASPLLLALASIVAGTFACSAGPTEGASGTQSSAVSYPPLPPATPQAWGAADLANAYDIPVGRQANTTIAILASDGPNWTFDDPSFESDLAMYRGAYGLPACTQSTGCLRKVNENGAATPLPPVGNAQEAQLFAAALDVASAACPSCKLLVVDLLGFTPQDFGTAVTTAARLGASVVVFNGLGVGGIGSTGVGPTSVDAIFASSGATVFASPQAIFSSYPSTSPAAIAVGSTALSATGGPAQRWGWSDTATGSSGHYSYCIQEPKPSWQHDTVCSGRTLVDAAATGGPVWTFNTWDGDVGWVPQTSTGIAATLVAGIFAQTGNGGAAASYPYTHSTLFDDVTSGSQGSCGALCTAGVGYDAPTGVGTPDGYAMAGITQAAQFSMFAGRLEIAQGQANVGLDVEATVSGWPNPGNVAFTATGLPDGVTAKYTQTGNYVPPVQGVHGAFEFSAAANAQLEQRTVVITGTSGSVSFTRTLEVTVVPATDAGSGSSSGGDSCGGCPRGTVCQNGLCVNPNVPQCPKGTHDCGDGTCAKVCF
jgi:hypothetical protein